jgi:hypothetical protein
MNTYVRYFSSGDKDQADKIHDFMKKMGFDVDEQLFGAVTAARHTFEVWIGNKQGSLSKH